MTTAPSEAQREKHQANNALIIAGYRISELTVQRDALQQVIDRLTSDEAVTAVTALIAQESERNSYGILECECCQERLARAAITAAIAVACAHNEGGK